MAYPRDPNHPLNTRPFYKPGQASFASPGYSGYGGIPQGYQPAQFSEADYARNPGLGASPRVRQMSGQAFGMGQKMAALRDPVGMNEGRMQASLAKAQAPMTPQEHQQILAQYGGRGYMGGRGLMASAQPGPSAAGPPAMQGPAAPAGLMGPPEPSGLAATAPQTPAVIGSPAPKASPFGPDEYIPNLDLRLKQAENRMAALRQPPISPMGPQPIMTPAQQMQMPPAYSSPAATFNAMAGNRFVGASDMNRWFPQIAQEDALRMQLMQQQSASQQQESSAHSRLMLSEANAREQQAGRHPLIGAIQQGVAAGTIPFQEAQNQLALLMPQQTPSIAPVTPPGAPPPPTPNPPPPVNTPATGGASALAAGEPSALDAARFLNAADPRILGAFNVSGEGGAVKPGNMAQVYSALASLNPKGFNDPNSDLARNIRAYARQSMGVDEYQRQLKEDVPVHPGKIPALIRATYGFNPFTSTQQDVDNWIEQKMQPYRFFGGDPSMRAKIPPFADPNDNRWRHVTNQTAATYPNLGSPMDSINAMRAASQRMVGLDPTTGFFNKMLLPRMR